MANQMSDASNTPKAQPTLTEAERMEAHARAEKETKENFARILRELYPVPVDKFEFSDLSKKDQ
jgi:hypothetical protein